MKSISNYLPLAGQLVIIFGLVGTLCFVVNMVYKMPYTLWYIIRNRLRYINKVGWLNFAKSKVLSIYPTNRGQNIELDYHPVNESWLWFKDNPLYMASVFYFWSTIGVIYGLIMQFSLNQVFNKPQAFFFASPIRSISLVYMLVFLVAECERLRRENVQLRKSNNNLMQTIINKHYT